MCAGGENPLTAEPNQCLERGLPIAHRVESPMERDRHRPRRCDEVTARRQIDVPGGIERTDDDTVAAEARALLDVVLHDTDLCLRITEVSGTRPDQNVQRQG